MYCCYIAACTTRTDMFVYLFIYIHIFINNMRTIQRASIVVMQRNYSLYLYENSTSLAYGFW